MWHTDAAGHDRTTRPELRCADLPVHALRVRREFPEGTLVRKSLTVRLLTVQHGNARLGEHGSFVAYFDQAKARQNCQIFVADGRHFQPASLYVPQCPAETDSPLEAEFSKGIVCHSRSIIGPPGSDLSCCNTSSGAQIMRQPPSGSRHRFYCSLVSNTMLNGVSAARRQRTKPLSVTTCFGRAPSACAPGTGCVPQ